MDATAMQLLAEHGMDGTGHRARQLTASMLREADLVLGMEKGHVDTMVRLAPESERLHQSWGYSPCSTPLKIASGARFIVRLPVFSRQLREPKR